MEINRIKSPASPETFTIKPIKELLRKYVKTGKGWIDPYAGNNSPAEYTNDLNPSMKTKYHKEALEFCNLMKEDGLEFEGILLDPPYSARQIKENYDGIGLKTGFERGGKEYSPCHFYWDIKRAIAPNIKAGGFAISFGWNSTGFGKRLGFEVIEIMLVNHGGVHNDTIIIVEQKVNTSLKSFIPKAERSSNIGKI